MIRSTKGLEMLCAATARPGVSVASCDAARNHAAADS